MHLSSGILPYTYLHAICDLKAMAAKWPGMTHTEIIGQSTLQRPIYALTIGEPTCGCHILFQGSIHGREYATSYLLMHQAYHLLKNSLNLLSDTCFHFIPTVNPDGVLISQNGKLQGLQEAIYRQDKWENHTKLSPADYAKRWKANAMGIDLNRNFPAGWDSIVSRPCPSSENYKGNAPLCAPESRLLAHYTLRFPFAATISYHASGSVIYYEYGTRHQTIARSRQLAKFISHLTGYPPISDPALTGGGYKDWAMQALAIPSVTIEIGKGETPLSHTEYPDILSRNLNVPKATAKWCLEQEKRQSFD